MDGQNREAIIRTKFPAKSPNIKAQAFVQDKRRRDGYLKISQGAHQAEHINKLLEEIRRLFLKEDHSMLVKPWNTMEETEHTKEWRSIRLTKKMAT